ncbi:MAG: polysaccharide deacetylase family protein [Nitrosarchaeum sp.]|nr:polysaccharide deacetylase family protein [Nitrosarchaeum sp.]
MQARINLVFYSVISILFFSMLIQNTFAENTGNIDLLIKYENGNKAGVDSLILKIYKDLEKTPVKEIQVENNPVSITNLELGHKYKIEVYYNDHYQATDYYDLKEKSNNEEIVIKLSGGIKVGVFYNDGQTPIPNTSVFFKTMNGKIVGFDETDFNGDTVRFWLPQTIDNDYYSVDIVIDPALKFTYTPLKIQSSNSKDIKIITEWPKIINSAITVDAYKDQNTKLLKSDGNFLVQVNDKKKTKIAESPISDKGEATISNIPIGTYAFHIISKDDGKVIASKKVTLSGNHEPIKIFTNNQQLNMDSLYCNCVAFRFDDVQDYFLSSTQIQMMKTFGDMDAGITIGVIGGVIGNDPKVVDAIKEQIHTNPRFEIASHSWNNKVITSVSSDDQEKYIKNTDDKIQQLFQVKPKVFIPPENIFDNKTITILKKYGYDHISPSVSTEIPPKFVKSDFYHFDIDAYTAKLNPVTSYWEQLSKDKILEQIDDSLFDYGYAVVMMHPFEFSKYVDGSYVNEVNQTKFDELKSIISTLKSKGYLLTPVGKIDKYDSETFQKNIENQTINKENTKPNCSCVAFKIDNVQDFWLNDVQNNLISTFSDNGVPVTISILGKFFGNDPKVVDLLKKQSDMKNSQMDIAIRGWELVDHSVYGIEEQSASIQKTNDQIYKILGINSKIFSPPFGKFNNYTTDALKQNNISYISAMTTTDAANVKINPIHIPETSYMPNLLDDDPFLKGTIEEKMLSKIQTQQKQYGYALISMQPSDFAIRDGEFKNEVNEERIGSLQNLIIHLKQNNIKIVSLTDIHQQILFEKYPLWVKQIYVWHEQKQITDTELDNAINNLVSRSIIIVY